MKTPTIRKILQNLRAAGRTVNSISPLGFHPMQKNAIGIILAAINDLTVRQKQTHSAMVKVYEGQPIEILAQGRLDVARMLAKQPDCKFQVKKASITIEG